MVDPSTPPLISDRSGVTDSVRVQILATEHWNLLATRSMTWNEAFSRTSIFLTVLSAAVVALALVAQATAFGEGFRLFALLVLPIVLLLGLGTYSRLGTVNEEDAWLVIGMNRLRHAYIELAPELEPYFITSHHDDLDSIWLTYGGRRWSFGIVAIFSSTPNIIGVIDAVLAGVLAALIAEILGSTSGIDLIVGGITALVVLAMLLVVPFRRVGRFLREYEPRFPH
ncbi:MAG: hypothetical protein ABI670_13830 [Chloroflexota bacterium]